MVRVIILEQNKDYLIKEVRYKKAHFNGKFRDKIEILAYFDESCKMGEGETNFE